MYTTPALRPFAEPLLGTPYEAMDCYQLLTRVYRDGLGLEIGDDPMRETDEVVEIWFRGFNEPDRIDLIVQPWDVLVMAIRGQAGDHVGVVVDETFFVHTGQKTGMVLGKTDRFKQYILQVLRPRILQGSALREHH